MGEPGYEQLGAVFTEALAEVILTATGFSLDSLPPKGDERLFDMIGMMGLYGKNHGMLYISLDEAALRVLCSYMIGAAQEEITRDDLTDALCELVNMTAGGAKRQLSGDEDAFSLSPPFVVSGRELALTTKRRVQQICGHLGNEELNISMTVVFY